MEDLFFEIELSAQVIYMSLILLVIGNALKDIPLIRKWMIIWILLAISLLVEFVLNGINFQTLFQALVSTSLATMMYQIYKQTKRGIIEIKIQKSIDYDFKNNDIN